jgi:hypothetical protein
LRRICPAALKFIPGDTQEAIRAGTRVVIPAGTPEVIRADIPVAAWVSQAVADADVSNSPRRT